VYKISYAVVVSSTPGPLYPMNLPDHLLIYELSQSLIYAHPVNKQSCHLKKSRSDLLTDSPIMNTAELNCTVAFHTPSFEKVGVVRAAVSALSLLMCCGAIVISLLLKRWKVFNQRLVLYLLIAGVLISLSTLIGVEFSHDNSASLDNLCRFSGYLTQTSALIFLNAVFAITIYLFLLVVADYNSDKYRRLYFLAIFLPPLLITWVPFTQDAYGKTGVWCWIKSVNQSTCEDIVFGQYMEYFLYYVPIYLLLLIMIFLYLIMVLDIIRRQRKNVWLNNEETKQKLKMMKSELLSLAAYPLIYAILNIPPIINRIYSSRNPEDPSLVLWYLSGLFGPLHGIFTVIVFSVATKMWHFSCFRIAASWKRPKSMVRNYPFGESYNKSNSLPITTKYGYGTLKFQQSEV